VYEADNKALLATGSFWRLNSHYSIVDWSWVQSGREVLDGIPGYP
jgi:hypothetical protein